MFIVVFGLKLYVSTRMGGFIILKGIEVDTSWLKESETLITSVASPSFCGKNVISCLLPDAIVFLERISLPSWGSRV